MRILAAGLVALASLIAVHSAALAAESLKATSMLIAGDDDRTRVIVDFNQKPAFSVRYLQNPNRTIVDIPSDVSFDFPPESAAAKGLYSLIRYGAMSAGHTRIVLTSQAPSSLEFAKVEAGEGGQGFRLVLDGVKTTAEKLASLVKDDDWQDVHTTRKGRGDRLGEPDQNEKAFVVAVDAGHGGIDTGAVSRQDNTEEKNITLAFARELAAEFNKRPGFKAFLTRSEDVFLSLSERVRIARQNGANLMISLHADTLRQKNIRGATIYTISEKASDRLAAELAQRENVSDEIAGVVPEDTSAEASDILIDLTRRETQAFSERLAQSVVNAFEGQIKLINNPHRHAGFRVLRAPDVPSILIELGFLSNSEDEKLLKEESYRKEVSGLIVDATDHYKKIIGQ